MKPILVILTIVVLLANVFVINEFTFYERRWTRLLSVVVFFVCFLAFKSYKNRTLFLIFILLLVIDINGLNYEGPYISKLVPFLKICIYFIMAVSVFKKIRLKEVKKPILLIFGVILSINALLVYQVVLNSYYVTKDVVETVLLFFYEIVMILICVVSVNYNFNYYSKRSLYFLYFIFASVFSDLTWYIAYYMNFDLSYYFDISFHIIGLLAFVQYSIEPDDKFQESLF